MLRVDNISKSFGAKEVLAGASFELKPGSIAGLIGPSGGGKSVLMKIIGGVSRHFGGHLTYVDELASDQEPGRIGLMFQEGALFDSLNVLDNVAFPLVSGRAPTALLPRQMRMDVFGRVSSILSQMGLSQAISKMPAQLSGGMRRRVSLARALVSKPGLVLLDDPTAGLDPVASSVIMNLILDFHRAYRPIMLIVSHDLRRLLPVVDTILALYDGKIKFNGTLDDLRCDECQFLRKFISCRFDLNHETAEHPQPN